MYAGVTTNSVEPKGSEGRTMERDEATEATNAAIDGLGDVVAFLLQELKKQQPPLIDLKGLDAVLQKVRLNTARFPFSSPAGGLRGKLSG